MRIRKAEPVAEVCPNGNKAFGQPGPGPFHHFTREVRKHPVKPWLNQDRMICVNCADVLYDWESFRPRVLSEEG